MCVYVYVEGADTKRHLQETMQTTAALVQVGYCGYCDSIYAKRMFLLFMTCIKCH